MVKLNVVLVVCIDKIPLSLIVTVKTLCSKVTTGVPDITPVAGLKNNPPVDVVIAGTTEYVYGVDPPATSTGLNGTIDLYCVKVVSVINWLANSTGSCTFNVTV